MKNNAVRLALVAASLSLSLSLGSLAFGGAPEKPAKAPPAKGQRIDISVVKAGFVPASTKVKVGQPVTLVVTRSVERTCATEIVIKGFGIHKALPLNEPVEVTLTPAKPGKIRFACAMDMIAGELVAE